MELSVIGRIAETEWLKTFEMRPDMNLMMADFVVMPNHFHAIIFIGNNKYNLGNGIDDNDCGVVGRGSRDAMYCVSTIDVSGKSQPQNQFGPQSNNLGSIIRGFKSAVTTNARRIDSKFSWQPRYHEPIIRNSKSFNTRSS